MRDRAPQRLLLFLPPRLNAGGRAQFASGTVVSYVALANRESTRGEAPVALLPKASAVDLVFDSSDVFITAIESPKLSEGRLRMALPNILEDRLLAEAADCHFAFNVPRGGTGTTTIAAQPKMPVAVIDRGILTRALDVVTDAGFKVRAAYSEIYTVPAPAAGVLSVRVDRGRGIARSATHDGFAFDLSEDAVPPALALAVRQLGIKRIQVFGRDGARMSPFAAALNVQIDVNAQEADPASTETGVSLLQGAFAQGGMIGGFVGSSRLSLSSRAVRVPLLWAAAAVAVAMVGMNAYYLKLQGRRKNDPQSDGDELSLDVSRSHHRGGHDGANQTEAGRGTCARRDRFGQRLFGAERTHGAAVVGRARRQRRRHGVSRRRVEGEVQARGGRQPGAAEHSAFGRPAAGIGDSLRCRWLGARHGGGGLDGSATAFLG